MTQREKNTHLDRLQGYTLADWQPLFRLIPLIEKLDLVGEDNLISQFLKTVYSNPDIILVFDWVKWEEGKAVLNNEHPDFSQYDLITLCMFITAIVRADRFNEGYLNYCFRNGIMLNLLKALESRVERLHTKD